MFQKFNTTWLGPVLFDESKLETVVDAIDTMVLDSYMNVSLHFVVSNKRPLFYVSVFYRGDEQTGRSKFKSIFDLEPVNDHKDVLPQNRWNEWAAAFCTKGGRKPAYSAGIKRLKKETWRTVFNIFADFTSHPGTEDSIVMMEVHSTWLPMQYGKNSSAYLFHDILYNAVFLPSYKNEALDPIAQSTGQKMRDLWWTTGENPVNST